MFSRMKSYVHNTLRAEQIVMVLVKHGLGDWVARLRLLPRHRRAQDAKDPIPETTRAQRLRLVLEELGPTYVKLGQILSNRSDILPSSVIHELVKLQDRVPPFPWEEVEKVFRQEFGQEVDQIFPVFKREPMASASIAQVHEAWLPDGLRVAVKVQRPGIEATVRQDVEVLLFIARLAVKYIPEIRPFDPVGLIRQFSRQIAEELDFGREAYHVHQFAAKQGRHRHLVIPRVWEAWSTRRIITLEYIQGTPLKRLMAHPEGHDLEKLSRHLANSMLEQVFINGFFHADPHPGNILVLEDSRICFLDFGMMGRLGMQDREHLGRILQGMVQNDAFTVTEAIEEILTTSIPGRETFQMEVQELSDIYMNRRFEQINIAQVLEELIKLMRRHQIIIPAKFMLVARAFMIAEGVSHQLSPRFSFMSVFGPFSRRMLLDRLRPSQLRRQLAEQSEAYTRAARQIPLDLAQTLRLLRKGDLHLGFRVEGIEPLRDTIDQVGTRFTFGLVLAATLVSSALMVQAGIPPLVYGIPLIGMIGFVIAGFMTLGFLVDLIARILHRARKGE